jgi:hypothetical protein
MNKFLGLLLFLSPLLLCSQNSLRFVGERIDFEIDRAHFTTNGLYFLANVSDRGMERVIIFPFAENADSINVKHVFNLKTKHKVDFNLLPGAISFSLYFAPHDTIGVNVFYTQKTGPENIYILESTQAWGKALKSAKYSLQVDASVVVDGFSYPPDSQDGNVYYWDKKDFYPKENFKVFIK